MEKDNEMLDTVDLVALFNVLLRRIWVIILAALIFGAAALGYTYFMVDPQYESSVLMYVNNSDISVGGTSVSISNADLTAAQKLVSTYVVILESRTVLNEVKEAAGVSYTYQQLKSMISASAVNSTEIFRIVVRSTSPTEAEKIANTIAEILPEKISDIVAGSDVRIVDYAVIPSNRSSPSYTRNTAIGMLIGVILSAAVIVLTYLFDENIHSEDYLTQTYPDIPLLAVIPDMTSSNQRGSNYGYQSTSSRQSKSKTGSSSKSEAASASVKRGTKKNGKEAE